MSESAIALLAEVTEALDKSKQKVRFRITDLLVERELTHRVNLLDKSLTKLGELKEIAAKIRPDVETFAADGTKSEPHYSKAKFEEMRKAKERLSSFEQAIERTLESGVSDNYNKLKEMLAKLGNSQSKNSSEGEPL